MHELVSPFQNLDTFGTFKSPFMNILRVFECIYCSLYSYIVIFFVFVSGVVLGSIELAMTFFLGHTEPTRTFYSECRFLVIHRFRQQESLGFESRRIPDFSRIINIRFYVVDILVDVTVFFRLSKGIRIIVEVEGLGDGDKAFSNFYLLLV